MVGPEDNARNVSPELVAGVASHRNLSSVEALPQIEATFFIVDQWFAYLGEHCGLGLFSKGEFAD